MTDIDRWINILQVYFSIHNFFDRENITFVFHRVTLHFKDWLEKHCEKKATKESIIFVVIPTIGNNTERGG